MPSVSQPASMNNSSGGIVTIGIRCNGDRAAIVLPIATDEVGMDKKEFTKILCDSVDAHVVDVLAACLASNAYISFIAADGMMDGMVPHRIDYGADEHPGEEEGECETSQVAGLIVYYQDPQDVVGGSRMKVAKNFIPGIPDAWVTGDTVNPSLKTNLDALALVLTSGFVMTESPAGKWYRVMSCPKPRNLEQNVHRVGVWMSRGYTATQRRRLIPH